MKVIPFVHEGLGNSSYLVELEGRTAAVIDPDRLVDRYLCTAEQHGWQIVAAFETHLHADFVSGAKELGHAGVGSVFLPAAAAAQYPHQPVRGRDHLQFAGCDIEVVASPGHTPEHLSYVVRPAVGPPVLFSGGSLLVSGAARTDLISSDQTAELTRAQYRTLHAAFTALPDETLLYPTHGGGSFCSTGPGGERSSTLGRERATNPLLAMTDEAAFVRWFPSTFPAAPAYFFRLRPINQAGPRLRQEIPASKPLSPAEFNGAREHALIVDVRSKEAYAVGHIPGSLSNAFRDAYATWLGWVVAADTSLLFVTDGTPLGEVMDQSLLVGYERFAGWLEGGFEAWAAAGLLVQAAPLVSPAEARAALLNGALSLDVRESNEFAAGHLPEAVHIPLGILDRHLDTLPMDRPIVAYCGHGERSATAVSLLERTGFTHPLLNLDGGFDAWRAAGYPTDRAA